MSDKISISEGDSFTCPHCQSPSIAKLKTEYDGFTIKRSYLVCAFCQAELYADKKKDKRAQVPVKKPAPGKLASLFADAEESGAPVISDCSDDQERRFCKNCRHNFITPFKCRVICIRRSGALAGLDFQPKIKYLRSNMRFIFHPLFLLCIGLLAAVGCISGRRLPASAVQSLLPAGQAAEFWLEYHPYPQSAGNSATQGAAIPHFDGWTDLRMERDLHDLPAGSQPSSAYHAKPWPAAFLRNACKNSISWPAPSSPHAIALVIRPGKRITLSLPNTMNFSTARLQSSRTA